MKTFRRFSTLALFLAVTGLANVAFSQGGGGGGGGNTGGGGTTGGNTGGTNINTGGTNSGTSGNSTTSGNTNSGTGTPITTGVNGRKYVDVGAKTKAPTTGNRRYTNVGAKTTTGSASSSRGATGATGGLGGGGLGTSSFGLNQAGTKTGSTAASPTVRTRLTSGVDVPSRPQVSSPGLVQPQVSQSIAQTRFRGVGVTVADNTTVIGGTVKSESDRRMAELLLRLEPGVSRVDNRITVAP